MMNERVRRMSSGRGRAGQWLLFLAIPVAWFCPGCSCVEVNNYFEPGSITGIAPDAIDVTGITSGAVDIDGINPGGVTGIAPGG